VDYDIRQITKLRFRLEKTKRRDENELGQSESKIEKAKKLNLQRKYKP
jgi:hypothetical protein